MVACRHGRLPIASFLTKSCMQIFSVLIFALGGRREVERTFHPGSLLNPLHKKNKEQAPPVLLLPINLFGSNKPMSSSNKKSRMWKTPFTVAFRCRLPIISAPSKWHDDVMFAVASRNKNITSALMNNCIISSPSPFRSTHQWQAYLVVY